MAYSTVTSSAGNRDLDAGYTVSLTNSGGSGDCRVELAIGGASTNQLHTDGQLVTLTFKIDSRFVQQIDWTIPSGSLKAFRPASPIFVGTGKTLTVLIESSNSNDTAVEVVATLLDAQLQSKAQADSDQDDLETAIGNVPSAVEVRQEMDSNSTKLKVAAAGAAGSVAVTDNEDGTLTLSFKDTDGTTEVANTTYTTETGVRTRNS